jgi:hypothetical protein
MVPRNVAPTNFLDIFDDDDTSRDVTICFTPSRAASPFELPVGLQGLLGGKLAIE